MKYHFLLLVLCVTPFLLLAQQPTQNVKGKITDQESQFPLAGVNIIIIGSIDTLIGTTSDDNGYYIIENIPVGRYEINYSMIGYNAIRLNNIILTSGKEIILDIEMSESSLQLNEVTITGEKQAGDAQNDMSYVSAKAFSVEETDRYAGSRGDPSRMASNYAGVQGADDSRNDIVIRGNSPSGVLWRLEGIDIFNPNHFAISGTSGGSVSILNNKFLRNSDFYTGAFPAEYGNSIEGVFDLRMRNGNNERHEQSFQFGFLGTDIMLEGPLSRKSKASYMVMYRYATLRLMGILGIRLGTDAIPRYQDAAIRLNYPMKKNQNLSLFALGGMSAIYIKISDQKIASENIYGQNDRDQYFSSNMAAAGLTYSKSLNENTFIKSILAYNFQGQDIHHELVYRHTDSMTNEYINDSLVPVLGYNFRQEKLSNHTFISHKFNNTSSIKAGILTDYYFFNFIDSLRQTIYPNDSLTYWQYQYRWHTDKTGNNQVLQLQPYVQIKYHPNAHLTLHAGIHAHYWGLNKQWSYIEPRVGFNYTLSDKSMLSGGIGLHSKIQSTYLYYNILNTNTTHPHNINMGFSKSWHNVIGYTYRPNKGMQMKGEIYYQYLFELPISETSSSFSLANTGVGFSRFFPDKLVNKGTGRNYGIELTAEKFFTTGYYFLLTATLYDARYKGSDNIWRNSDFNGQYIANALFAKEYSIRKKHTINIGTKITYAGGSRYTPVDTTASDILKEVIGIDSLKNTLRTPSYFRTDLRIAYRINAKKVSHEIALDLVNFLNRKNILKLTYAPGQADGSNIRFDYQLGFLPLFYYKIDFSL